MTDLDRRQVSPECEIDRAFADIAACLQERERRRYESAWLLAATGLPLALGLGLLALSRLFLR